MRNTRQKEVILKVLASTKTHPDADWIYRKARDEVADISLGTVYRNLRTMTSEGQVQMLRPETGSTHYDADVSAHAHFMCRTCGAIYDGVITAHPEGDCGEEGFDIEDYRLIFYGTCSNCKSKTN